MAMQLARAKSIAEKWVKMIKPACVRVEIAGSIRREEAQVRDIDIVCIPSITPVRDMFNDPTGLSTNNLENLLNTYKKDGEYLTYNPDDASERTIDGSREKKLHLPEGIKLELWIVLHPAQWGVIFTIRTGPREYGHWLVTSKQHGGALPGNLKVKDGALQSGFRIIKTPEETDFFREIGLPYVQPKDRKPNWSQP